jgi:uncharacterized metal-binding protein
MSEPKESDNDRVLIVACSGIGKAFGSVGREATYVVVEELRPEETDTVCLARLTLDDEESHGLVRGRQTIAIDGCPKACARISIEQAGGTPGATFRVFDVFRAHKELRVAQVSDIGDNGRELARILAEEIAAKVDELRNEKKSEGK